MSFLRFKYTPKQALTIVEDAIQYAVAVTKNLLYETDLNSPFRLLVESQAYIYNQFLITLELAENALTTKFLEIMGFAPEISEFARVRLKFELLSASPPTENTYIRKGFPVRATNGLIFVTDAVLLIPQNTTIGYVWATATKAGAYGNVAANTVTLPLQTINIPLSVTNLERAVSGKDGESLIDAQFRLAAFIRKNGLITAQDYIDFVREQIPNAIVSVASLEPNTVSLWVANFDGSTLNRNQFSTLQGNIDRFKMIGLGTVAINDIQVLKVYIEVVAAIAFPSQAGIAADEIRDLVFNYVSPENIRQTAVNTAGLIILNDLERVINAARIDYIQGVKIGLEETTAYGQNFEFNQNSQRVKCDRLRVVLIRDTYQLIKDYTR